jgi:uncharacterized protein (DUF2384 family)
VTLQAANDPRLRGQVRCRASGNPQLHVDRMSKRRGARAEMREARGEALRLLCPCCLLFGARYRTVARAVYAFGDVGKALRWLRRDVPSLRGRKPIELLRTEMGTRDVLSDLDRIEFGGVS